MNFEPIAAISVLLIILVSGCAGQQVQTSDGAVQQTQQTEPAQQLAQTVSSSFPEGWQLTKSEENPSPGRLLSKDVSSFYKRGSEQLVIKQQTYKDASDIIFDALPGAPSNVKTERFSIGDGAYLSYSNISLLAAGHKGDLYVNVRYLNQPDGSYKPKDLPAEKELVRNVVRNLLG